MSMFRLADFLIYSPSRSLSLALVYTALILRMD